MVQLFGPKTGLGPISVLEQRRCFASFAPFVAEYYAELPFGSLWKQWRQAVIAAAENLPFPLAQSDGDRMEETQVVIRKRVEGEVEVNDGEFAEVQTSGIEGIEKDLLLEPIQIHREDTNDTPEEFQRRFSVGACLDIRTTTKITNKSARASTGAAEPAPKRSTPTK